LDTVLAAQKRQKSLGSRSVTDRSSRARITTSEAAADRTSVGVRS